MADRRTFLLGLAALPLAPAGAAEPADGLWYGEPGAEVLVPFLRPRWRPLDNLNASWQLELEVPRPPMGQFPPARLVRGGAVWENGGQGGDAARWAVTFTLYGEEAAALEPWIGGVRRDRVPLGRGLVATFAHAGGSRVALTLENRGATGVGVQLGGQNRGPRDNQWRFSVRRDGLVLPERDGLDFGGLSQIRFLPSGTSLSRAADVAAWADCAPPGRYDVSCHWDASLVPGDSFPTDPSDWWDATFEGQVTWTT